MFSSNQEIIITGKTKEELAKSIKFILDYCDCKIEDIKGVKKENTKLVFGLCPKNEKTKEYKEEFVKKYDYIIPMKSNLLIISEIINQFLIESDYSKMYRNKIFLETPFEGFKITAINDRNKDFKELYFGIFYIEPFLCEYDN